MKFFSVKMKKKPHTFTQNIMFSSIRVDSIVHYLIHLIRYTKRLHNDNKIERKK